MYGAGIIGFGHFMLCWWCGVILCDVECPLIKIHKKTAINGGFFMDLNEWNAHQLTNRADNGLLTRSKSLVIDAGKVIDDGDFRIEINEVYGYVLP